MPETPPLYPEMTVKEFIDFAGRLRGMDREQLASRVPEVLRLCGIESVKNQVIGTLSHGYKQRVGIAQAIVHDPALLILDEPIKGLDPVQIVEMREMIRSLRGKHTILLSSHILTEIEKTCDRILMIHKGALAGEGTEEELAKRFTSEFRMELEIEGTAEAAKNAIATLPNVKQSEIESIEDRLRIRVTIPHHDRALLSKALVNAGLGLTGMHTLSSGLETAFVQMSQQEQSKESEHA
ncbi:MAG: ABC transporter ATP-binding protein [Myxococcales bacterium]|nr:MAG: ABC transporter ATP-binding protein [Myxococcales bacterium]